MKTQLRPTGLKHQDLTASILEAAIEVHRALGPGLFESAYCACLDMELSIRRIRFAREVPISIRYRDRCIDSVYRADFIVAEKVILEVKAVASLERVHEAQLRTDLKLTGLEVGMLMNFNTLSLRKGLRRIGHNHAPSTLINLPELPNLPDLL